jgi:hypothetical protein
MALDYSKGLPDRDDATLLLQVRDAITDALVGCGFTHTGGGFGFGGADCGFETADHLIDIEISTRPRDADDLDGDDGEDGRGTARPREIAMTEQETMKEYCVTVRGQLETTTHVRAPNETVARMRTKDQQWTGVFDDLDGEEGAVCEALNRDMALEVVKVECLRELPPAPPPPPNLYNEAIMRTLLDMLAVCVKKEKASYDGAPDHAYHQLYGYMETLVAMWKSKGLTPKLDLPSPAELDAERAQAQETAP